MPELARSNGSLVFATYSILADNSREFGNLGKEMVGYYPVKSNQIEIRFTDGRKVFGLFDANTTFVGTFGEQLISQWRDPADPAKANEKAKNDITNLVRRYLDKDGPGPGSAPTYLNITVTEK